MEYARDGAMSALILGFFASSWFGWAQEKPPPGWRALLVTGAVLSLAIAGIGAVLAWRTWSGGSVLDEPGAMRRYGMVVGVEFGVAAVGALVLAVCRRLEYLSAWICLVVGLHFAPMAPILDSPPLIALGLVLTGVAVAAVLLHRRTGMATSAATGIGAGFALLSSAIWGAAAALS